MSVSASQADPRRVAWGLALRSLRMIPRIPSTFIPSLVMPVMLTIGFAGPFASLVLLPGFPADKIIDWIVPMATIQGAAFAGVTTGLGVARDIESGFYDRMLSSPVSEGALLAGPLLASVLRATLPLGLLIVVALIGKATFYAGLGTLVPLALAALGIAFAAGAWALGLAYRFGSQQKAAPLMQMGVFLSVFLSTAQMPLELLTGWVKAIARLNPMTNVLSLARQGFLGDLTWAGVWPGLVSLLGLNSLLLLFAARGLRRRRTG